MRTRATNRRNRLLIFLAPLLLVAAGCTSYLRSLDSTDSHLSGETFTYDYEITGLRSLPGRPLRMSVDLHFDFMPDLHVERVRFLLGDDVIAVADPYFVWYLELVDAPNGEVTPTVMSPNPALWATIDEMDGAALRALFDPYESARYPGLRDFDDLAHTESTPLDLRLLGSERTSALFPFDRIASVGPP